MAHGMAFEFLDVGQGDGTLVQMPPWDTGQLWLVDFGKKSNSDTPINDALKFLVERITTVCKGRGSNAPKVPTLDYLVITHPDGDHWNRLDNLISGQLTTGGANLWEKDWGSGARLHVKTLIFGGKWSTYQWRNYPLSVIVWNASASYVTIPDGYACPATTPNWSSGGADVYILSANRGNWADANPDSIVLMFAYAGKKVILTGDAETKVVEKAILDTYSKAFLKSDILKLGHHGSKASSGAAWLEAVQPQVATASGDKRWGHPYVEPFSRAKTYLTTGPLHRFCGSSGVEQDDAAGNTDDYQNFSTTKMALTNLWYVVKTDSEKLEYTNEAGTEIEETHSKGFYSGTQWRIQIDADGALHCNYLRQWPEAGSANWPTSSFEVVTP